MRTIIMQNHGRILEVYHGDRKQAIERGLTGYVVRPCINAIGLHCRQSRHSYKVVELWSRAHWQYVLPNCRLHVPSVSGPARCKRRRNDRSFCALMSMTHLRTRHLNDDQ